MMNLKSIFLLIFVFVTSSCATNYEEEKAVLLSNNETTDLVSSFDLDKEQAEKFKESQKKEETPVKAVTEEHNSSVPKKSSKKTVKKEKSTKQVVAVTTSPAPIQSDYSEEFKGYDQKSKIVWDKFKPVFYQGEQSIMAITYLGVTAGHITISSQKVVNFNGQSAYNYFARFKSSDTYRYFYWLDDKLETFVEKDTFLPIKYSLIQREKKQNVDDLQLFDFKKMMTYHWYKRVKEGSNKEEKIEKAIPKYAQDSFTALQFVRGLPLLKGDIYEFPVITRGKIWLLKVEVLGEDLISVGDKEMKSIKIKAETNFPGVLKKSGDIIFWYGADAERKLLKFQAKIKIGSVYGELVEYKPGTMVKP